MNDLMYHKAVFYVMSGTGNTHRMACRMKEIVDANVDDIKILMIDETDAENQPTFTSGTLVGILFPTHGFMPPWSMIKFLLRMRKQKGVPAMCAATRGGIKIGPLRIPGIAGMGTFLAALLMLIKGYRPRALFSLDMPSNFINFHWGLHSKNVKAISGKAEQKLTYMVNHIFEGRRIYFTRNNLWEALWSIFILWLVPIFPLIYLLFGKLFMAKIMFSNNNCVGCGLCARFCPNQAIEMKSVGKKKCPFWTYHCEVCLRCMGYCRKRAVEAGQSWAVILYFITTVPIISLVWLWLHESFSFYPVISGEWTMVVLDFFNLFIYTIYYLAAILVSYWILWSLTRLPFFNTFFSLTTLTHYYRRYHQPDTKLKHLAAHKGRTLEDKAND